MLRGAAATFAGFVLLFAGCRFPELPVIGEDAGGDAAVADGAIDGPPLDAEVDARPVRTGPLVTNNQAADLVIGQPSFGTNSDRGITAQSFQPEGIAFASGRLWAADFGRHRVLGWSTPASSDPSANYLLGQTSFTSGAVTAATANTLWQPTGVAAHGSVVMTVDSYNRALIWTSLPATLGQSANLVLGQPDFTSQTIGTGPAGLRVPLSAWTDGTRVIIRGGFTSMRMWIWNSFPTTNAAPSDVQLLGGVNSNASEFGPALGVFTDGVKLVVSDAAKNRVLIWNTIPTVTGTPADIVIGQPTFTSAAAGSGAAALDYPSAAVIIDGALVVADTGNDRVLVFDPLPTASGASASQVLGQTSTATSIADQSPSDRSLNQPVDFAIDGRHLFVADRVNRRILRYTLNLP